MCVPDYLPGDHSASELGLACLKSALTDAPEVLRSALIAFSDQVLQSTPLDVVSDTRDGARFRNSLKLWFTAG